VAWFRFPGYWSVTIEIVNRARAAGSLARRATKFNPQEQV
jgi:hypothetical protein